jgi:hypothetical protein
MWTGVVVGDCVRSRRVAGHWAQAREGSGVNGKLHLDFVSVHA